MMRLLVTDVDGSMINNTSELPFVKPWIEKLLSNGVTIVINTAKTIDEILHITDMLEIEVSDNVILVPEVGGAICSTRPLPGLPLLKYHGLHCSIVSSTIREIEAVLNTLVKACSEATRISTATPRELEEILGLQGYEAMLAGRRIFNEAVYVGNPTCRSRVKSLIMEKGLEAVEHGKLIYVGKRVSKKRAVEKILSMPWLNYGVSVGIGDSIIDDFLEITDYSFLIASNQEASGWLRKWYIRVPYPPPSGWVWSVKRALFL